MTENCWVDITAVGDSYEVACDPYTNEYRYRMICGFRFDSPRTDWIKGRPPSGVYAK